VTAGLWDRLGAAVGDEADCTAALNALSTVWLHGWDLVAVQDRLRLALVLELAVGPDDPAAADGPALLVKSAAWSRVERCDRRGCARVFADATNAGNRAQCHGEHGRRQTR